jgi:hypothetical protein
MKPPSMPSSSLVIPAVTAAAAPGVSNKQILALLNENTVQGWSERFSMEPYLDMIRKSSDDCIPTAHHYLTTGCVTGRRWAAGIIRSDLLDLQFKKTHLEDYESSGELAQACSSSLGSAFNSKVVRSWSTGVVLEETGRKPHISGLRADIDYIDDALTEDDEYTGHRRALDPVYWRGVAALALSEVQAKSFKDQREFINWAGTHENISLVVDTAAERGTIVVSDLKAILEHEDVMPSLRVGIL